MSSTQRISLMALILSRVVCFGSLGAAFAQTTAPTSAAVAFDKLKTLAGRWEATTKIGPATASYEVVSNGTAVLEHLSVAGKHDMITVDYVDGNRLLLPRYCDSGNQPRMQASGFDTKTNSIDFHFLDVTNLLGPNAMHSAVIQFDGLNEIAENWTMFEDGKVGRTEKFDFRRAN